MKINLKAAAIFILFLILTSPKKSNADCQFTCSPITIDTVNHQVCMGFQNYCSCIVTSYYWDYGNGLTGNSQHGGTCFSYPGTYIVKVFGTCSNGLMDSSVPTVLVDYPNNIICNVITSDNNFIQSNDELSVFPNPFSDLLYFESHTEEGNIKIYNTLGNLLQFTKVCFGLNNLDVSFLTEGMYFLHISDGIESKKTILIKR